MTGEDVSQDNRPAVRLRAAARAIGTLAAAFWTFSLIASALGEMANGRFRLTLESAILGVLIVAAATGVIIGWRQEKIGGMVVTVVAITLGVFAYITAGHHKFFAALISGGIFLPGGLLFLANWRRSSRCDSPPIV